MHKTLLSMPEIKIVGLTAGTSNAQELNPDTAKIGPIMQKFFMDKIPDKILHKKSQRYVPTIPHQCRAPVLICGKKYGRWTMGGERSYIADFELYDERSHDYSNAVLDIYIGIKN